MAEAPWFMQGDGFNALAEFRGLLHAVGAPGVHLLAEFVHLQENVGVSGLPKADFATSQVDGLYCRLMEGWAVFYTAANGAIHRCRIGIILVGRLNPRSLRELESEAEIRLRGVWSFDD